MSRANPKVTLGAAVGYPAIGRIEGTYDVEAEAVTDTFAINRDVQIDSDGDVDYRKTWNVTHIPTGAAVLRSLPSAAAAKAAAQLLVALGYGEITTSNRDDAAARFRETNLSAVKDWVAQQATRSRTAKSLVDKINKRTRAAERGEGVPDVGTPAPPSKPAKKAAKKKAPRKAKKKAAKKAPKKAAKKKAKKKAKKPAARKIHEKPEEGVDLLALARRARGNPSDDSHPAKERLLGW